MEIDENNVNKSEERILFKIEKLSEFARAPVGTERRSNVFFVRGLPWRILAINREYKQARYLGYYLQCNADNPDSASFCTANPKLKILAQKEGKEDHLRPIAHIYSENASQWGYATILLSFEELMAPENGLYDEQADTIVLAADIEADASHGIKRSMMRVITFSNAKPNATIKVNKEAVEVNSYILTLYSSYFERCFFDNRYPPAENIELPPSTTIEDFKRLQATLPPENRKLDDDCVEAILILADRFFMDTVMELCRDFLLNESRKPKFFKFRIAHKYGWKEMKEKVLESINLDELSVHFFENMTEFGLLDDDAKAALSAHHAKLVSGIKK